MTFFLALLALLLALLAFVVIIPTVLHMNRLGEAVYDLTETVSDMSRDMMKVPAPRPAPEVERSLSIVEDTAKLATIGGRRESRLRAVTWHPPVDNVGHHWDTVPAGIRAVLAFEAEEWGLFIENHGLSLRHYPCGHAEDVMGVYSLDNIIERAKGHLPCPANG